MKGNEIVWDFITYVLYLILIIGGVYFIIGDYFDTFTRFLTAVAPLALFFVPFLGKISRWFRGHKAGFKFTTRIYLTNGDLIVMDILIFLVPTAIMFMSLIEWQGIALMDLAQAAVAFAGLYGLKAYIMYRGE